MLLGMALVKMSTVAETYAEGRPRYDEQSPES
jgi:hypothetical protein